MKDFLSNYGYWLFIGLMVFMMFRRGGCCGGHGSHDGHKKQHGENTDGPESKDDPKSCH